MLGRTERGVTIIEIVIVVALVLVIATVSAPFWFQNMLGARRVEGARDRVSLDLRRAQFMAVNNAAIVRFNYAAGTYRLETSADNGVTWVPASNWYSIGNEFTGVALASVQDNNATALTEIRFDSRGAARNTPAVAQFPVILTLSRGTSRGPETATVLVQRTGNVSTTEVVSP